MASDFELWIIRYEVIRFLDPSSLIHLARSSKAWFQFVSSSNIWLNFLSPVIFSVANEFSVSTGSAPLFEGKSPIECFKLCKYLGLHCLSDIQLTDKDFLPPENDGSWTLDPRFDAEKDLPHYPFKDVDWAAIEIFHAHKEGISGTSEDGKEEVIFSCNGSFFYWYEERCDWHSQEFHSSLTCIASGSTRDEMCLRATDDAYPCSLGHLRSLGISSSRVDLRQQKAQVAQTFQSRTIPRNDKEFPLYFLHGIRRFLPAHVCAGYLKGKNLFVKLNLVNSWKKELEQRLTLTQLTLFRQTTHNEIKSFDELWPHLLPINSLPKGNPAYHKYLEISGKVPVCKFFKKRTCKFGNTCRFLHSS